MTSPHTRRVLVCLALTAAFWAGATPASAQVILTVDASDPSNVLFQSTAALSALSNSNTGYGLFLPSFFATNTALNYSLNFASSSLAPAQGSITYNRIGTSSSSTNLVIPGFGSGIQTFVSGSQALTGSATLNMNIVASSLRTQSFIGDIHIRNDFGVDTGLVVAQFRFISAVPEPSPLGLGAMAALTAGGGTWLRRRWRRRVE